MKSSKIFHECAYSCDFNSLVRDFPSPGRSQIGDNPGRNPLIFHFAGRILQGIALLHISSGTPHVCSCTIFYYSRDV